MTDISKGKAAEEISIDTYKQIMVALVHASAVGLGEILKGYPEETERINIIRTYVNKIRFFPDQTGYFFVYNFECLNIALPNPSEWQGKNLYTYRDSHDKYVIRELSAVAKQGGGFIEWYWPKPSSSGEYKKLGYAESIPGTDYFIGTGFYPEIQ